MLQVTVIAEIQEPSSKKVLAKGEGIFYVRQQPAGISSLLSKMLAESGAREGAFQRSFPDILSYEEAILVFGSRNPRAAANVVEFSRYGAHDRRAKL